MSDRYGAGRGGTVLITGGNGFLGKALSRALLGQGRNIVSLDVAAADDPVPGVVQEVGDILDLEGVCSMAERHGIGAIVHLAAMVIPACKANPVKGAEVNVIGHINLLETARRLGISHFLYTSSVAARPRGPFDSPVNLYGAYKRCCEDISKIWYLDHGIPSVGLRPNVIYGPGRELGETAAITLAIRAAAQGKSYRMPFAGAMCFQYVDEVTDIMVRCLGVEPEGPVVSDLTTRAETIDDVLAAIRTIAPEADITPSVDMRPAPPELDNTALNNLIGEWLPVSLQQGVRRTFEYYHSHCRAVGELPS